MKPESYDRVDLRHDLHEYSLRRGDVALLVDWSLHPAGAGPGAVLEASDALGESILVVIVEQSAVEGLRANEVLAVRSIANTS